MNATKCIKSCFIKKEADDEILFNDEPVKESKDKVSDILFLAKSLVVNYFQMFLNFLM